MTSIYKKHFKEGSFDLSYIVLVLAAILALVLLITLRETTLAFPPLLLVAALTLFVLPGAVLVGLLTKGSYYGLSKLASVFTLSAGTFGLLGLPPLLWGWDLKAYLTICGGMLVLSAIGAILLAVRNFHDRTESLNVEPAKRWLWIPFVSLTFTLAAISAFDYRPPRTDTWAYLMYIREFVSTTQLGSFASGFSRTTLSGWLLEQAALSSISGIVPVDLVLTYLEPVLVIVSVLAFYGLARTLFESELAALICGSFVVLLFLLQLNPLSPVPGDEFVGPLTEDKYVARFIFLPMALTLATSFLREKKLGYLILFAFVCCSVVTIHPIGFVLIGVSVAGFGLVHLAAGARSREAWKSIAALWGTLLALGLPPAVYLLTVGREYLPRPEKSSPRQLDAIRRLLLEEKLLKLDDGTYIAHPSLILNPVMLAAYLVGVPLLLRHLKRSLGTRLLLGTLLLVPVLVYLPPVAGFIGEASFTRLIVRLTWLLPPTAALTLGWVVWRASKYLAARLSSSHTTTAASFVAVFFVAALTVASAPMVWAGARSVDASNEIPQDGSTCSDPIFPWIEKQISEPNIVLAPNAETTCFAAYSQKANFMLYRFRDTPASGNQSKSSGVLADAQHLLNASAFDRQNILILRRRNIRYLLLSEDSPLNTQLGHLPGITPLDNPGERYRMYEVDASQLMTTPAVVMNGYLNQGDPQLALSVLDQALQGDENEQFLAYLAAGHAYTEMRLHNDAANSYEQALQLFPDSPDVYPLLADAYMADEDRGSAAAILERAVIRYPRDVDLRHKLGFLLLELKDSGKAVEQYRKVVETFQNVPEYHVQLGEALLRTRDQGKAEEEFGRAVYLDPLSPDTYRKIAEVEEKSGRLKAAAASYEEALRLTPKDQFLTLELGRVYYMLADTGKKDSVYFELAEEQLHAAAKESPEAQDSVRGAAYLELGNLYYKNDRPKQAAASYRRALKIRPNFEQARRMLEVLNNS